MAGIGALETKKSVVMRLFMVIAVASGVGFAAGEVYKVGDAGGWTLGVEYSTWSRSKLFEVGDVIVFEYDPKFHNVVEVKTLDDYRKCINSSSVAVYTSGNDSIAIKNYGHRFFICGYPGHCSAGQKVDIRVVKQPSPSSGASAPSPFSAPPSASPNITTPPSSDDKAAPPSSQRQSVGGGNICKEVTMATVGIAIAAASGFLML